MGILGRRLLPEAGIAGNVLRPHARFTEALRQKTTARG